MNKPLISVVVPTYNRAYCLARALQSIANQSLNLGGRSDLIETIVVDDGSTDETQMLLNQKFSQVRRLSQENKGVSAARNLGIAHARGDWIAFLDSDDQWLPNKLEMQLAALEQQQLQVCHTEEVWIRNGVRVNQMKKHKKQGGWIFTACLPLCAMSPSSILIHRRVFDQVGLFDETMPACEDYELWLRIAAKFEVAFIETPLIQKYGGHEDQLSRKYWGMDRFRVYALEKCLQDESLDRADHQAALQMLIDKLKILLTGSIKRGNSELEEQCRLKLQHYETGFE